MTRWQGTSPTLGDMQAGVGADGWNEYRVRDRRWLWLRKKTIRRPYYVLRDIRRVEDLA